MEQRPSCVADRVSTGASDGGFADFMRAHAPVLMRKAYLLTGSRLAAEDLVQDTLARLYPRWTRVAASDVPLAYVQRSLTNNFLNQRRKRGYRELLIEAPPDCAARHSVEREVVDRDEACALLQTLSHRQRTVLILRFYEGFTDAEIAQRLACRPGTVRSLASRGLASLRELTLAA
jgi:RNA polymerase sigma-70 factor (sigma-E family)